MGQSEHTKEQTDAFSLMLTEQVAEWGCIAKQYDRSLSAVANAFRKLAESVIAIEAQVDAEVDKENGN